MTIFSLVAVLYRMKNPTSLWNKLVPDKDKDKDKEKEQELQVVYRYVWFRGFRSRCEERRLIFVKCGCESGKPCLVQHSGQTLSMRKGIKGAKGLAPISRTNSFFAENLRNNRCLAEYAKDMLGKRS